MRTTMELHDPLFARLKARAASEQVMLKQLLQGYVEQGLQAPTESTPSRQSAGQLPKLEGRLAIDVINGSELLRDWVDDPAAGPADLETMACEDESAWLERRAAFLLYPD